MNLMQFTPLPYDPIEWASKPFHERARMACQAWAMQGYAAPIGAYLMYLIKLVFYIGGWLAICGLTPNLHSLLDPIAFQKAILWSMLFEGLGLGCGSGPLAGRYDPPIGGVFYFTRRGTTKLPLFPRLPLLGGMQRTWLDVTLYLAAVASLVRALCAAGPVIDPQVLWPILVLVALLGVADKTIFLIFRGEHYWVTTLCFALSTNWIPGAKWVQIALWFWAGVSKLNHHFPTVVCVMISNSPLTRWPWLRRLMYRNYPDDVRPSRFATVSAHAGISLELGVPLVLLFSSSPTTLVVGMVMMVLLHSFITSNVPMGVPIEWNFMVVYGGFALFYSHPEISPFSLDSTPLAIILGVTLFVVPLIGNLFPSAVSFLLSMRYYAGNWPYSVWLFKGESQVKLDRVVKNTETIDKQMAKFYDETSIIGMAGRALAFRLMHLQGRVLSEVLPQAVERIDDYVYVDGELVASVVIGWNFGDGHLHQEQLLAAVQAQCGYEAGELRCIFVESQPFGRGTIGYRIVDAKTGVLQKGELLIRDLLKRQPWATQASVSIPPEPALEPLGSTTA